MNIKKVHAETISDFVAALNALGFNDPGADINGGDVVDVVNEFYDDLVLTARSLYAVQGKS
jgi:hypothetical protein